MASSGYLSGNVVVQSVMTTGVGTSAGNLCYTDSSQTLTMQVGLSDCCSKPLFGGKIHPLLYFTYIKKKFKALEKKRLDNRIKDLQASFDAATNQGQMLLGERFMRDLIRETRECVLYAKGIRMFITREDLWKHKSNIKGGHISDTKLQDYVRVIPKNSLKKIQAMRPYFDDIVILHYYNPDQKDLSKMTPEEKQKTKDPVAFGILSQSDRWYFITDWTDDHCDLTFEQIAKVIKKFDISKPELPKAIDC
jgi:hypothetical protein